MSLSEFELITRYFNRHNTSRNEVEQGIGDDCALLTISGKQVLAITTDTLVEGIHFLPNILPEDLAYKALAVNLSDLAAVGAKPAWLTLSLTIPKIDERWLLKFSNSLFDMLYNYNMQLIGGDITRGPLSLTLGAYGFLPVGHALKRSGAKLGDLIFVTGTLGDSAAGLSLLLQQHFLQDDIVHETLVKRHLRPVPRLLQGKRLLNIATSAIDLSDGLISDLNQILISSHVGANINVESIPISSFLLNHFNDDQVLSWALSGGEDYELCFTVPEAKCDLLKINLEHLGIPWTCIGKIAPKSEGLILFKDGKRINFIYKGFDHFDRKK